MEKRVPSLVSLPTSPPRVLRVASKNSSSCRLTAQGELNSSVFRGSKLFTADLYNHRRFIMVFLVDQPVAPKYSIVHLLESAGEGAGRNVLVNKVRLTTVCLEEGSGKGGMIQAI